MISQSGTATETTSRARCQVFAFEVYAAPQPQTPAEHTSIRELVGQWERETRIALEEDRRWVTDTFYGEEGDTRADPAAAQGIVTKTAC